MHNFRHPAALTLAFVLFTMVALAGVVGRASADGPQPDPDYPELFS